LSPAAQVASGGEDHVDSGNRRRHVRQTLAGLLSKAGEPVVIAASRIPTDIARKLGGSVTAATVADAIDHSEAVVFAV
jgi:predicted dinucleotide-binding enzyme